MLADERCRRLLFALLETPSHHTDHEPAELSFDGSVGEDTKIELYHMHLPKLEDAGFIRWNREEKQVHRGPAFADLRPFLARLRDSAETGPEDESPEFLVD